MDENPLSELEKFLWKIKIGEKEVIWGSDLMKIKKEAIHKEEFFQRLKEIDKLKKFYNDGCSSFIDSFSYFIDYLKHTKTLKSLTIKINTEFKKEDWDDFSEMIKKNNSIKKLHLIANKMYFDKEIMIAKQIMEAIKENKNIRGLILEDFDMVKEFSEQVADLLMNNNNITSFGLKYEYYSEKIFEFEPICEAFKKNFNLTSLLLRSDEDNGELRDYLKNSLVEILDSNPNIKKLDLKNLKLDHQRLVALLNSLSVHNGITSLNLSFNDLTDLKHEMEMMLSSNKSLQKLKISGCYDKNIFKQLKDGIELNESIRHLDISNNKVKDNGSQILSHFLTYKKWEHLDIYYLTFSEEGTKNMFVSLKNNKYLKYIRIFSKFDRSTVEFCLDCLKSNFSLQHLIFLGSKIPYGKLCELLSVNHTLHHIYYHSKKKEKRYKIKSLFNINKRISQNPCWSTNNHIHFEDGFKHKIFCVLICLNVFYKYRNHHLKIPKPILYSIFDSFSIHYLIGLKSSDEHIRHVNDNVNVVHISTKKRKFEEE